MCGHVRTVSAPRLQRYVPGRGPGLLFSSLDLQKSNNASCPYTDTADFTASSLACILSNVVEDMHYVHYGAHAQCDHVRGFVDSACTLFVHI